MFRNLLDPAKPESFQLPQLFFDYPLNMLIPMVSKMMTHWKAWKTWFSLSQSLISSKIISSFIHTCPWKKKNLNSNWNWIEMVQPDSKLDAKSNTTNWSTNSETVSVNILKISSGLHFLSLGPLHSEGELQQKQRP